VTEDEWRQIFRRLAHIPDVVGDEVADERIRALIERHLPDDVGEALSKTHGQDGEIVGQAFTAVHDAALNGDLDRFFLDVPGHTLTEVGKRLAPDPPQGSQDPLQMSRISAQIVESILTGLKDFVLNHPRKDRFGWFGPAD
jgi:hypothetical protein